MPEVQRWLRKTMQMEPARSSMANTSRTSSPIPNPPRKKLSQMFHKPASLTSDDWVNPLADIWGVQMPHARDLEPDIDALVESVFKELCAHYYQSLPASFNSSLFKIIEAYRDMSTRNFEKRQLQEEIKTLRSDAEQAEKKRAAEEALLNDEIKRLEVIIAKDGMNRLMQARQNSVVDRSRTRRAKAKSGSQDAILPPPSPSREMAALSTQFLETEASFSSVGDQLPDEVEASRHSFMSPVDKHQNRASGQQFKGPPTRGTVLHPLITRDLDTMNAGYAPMESGPVTTQTSSEATEESQGSAPPPRVPRYRDHSSRYSFVPGDDAATSTPLLPKTHRHRRHSDLSASSSESRSSGSPQSKIPVSASFSSRRTAFRDSSNQSLEAHTAVTKSSAGKGKTPPAVSTRGSEKNSGKSSRQGMLKQSKEHTSGSDISVGKGGGQRMLRQSKESVSGSDAGFARAGGKKTLRQSKEDVKGAAVLAAAKAAKQSGEKSG